MDPISIKTTDHNSTDNDSIKTTVSGQTLLTNSNPQQQLIILSSIKASTNKPLISSVKLMPNNNLPTLAPATQVIASTSNKLTTQINSGQPLASISNSNKNVHYINWLPFSTGNSINLNNSKCIPIKSANAIIKPNLGQKVLINPSTIKISTTIASSASTSQTINSNQTSTNKKPNSIWMFPKHILKPNGNSLVNKSKYIPIAPSPIKSSKKDTPKVFTTKNKYL